MLGMLFGFFFIIAFFVGIIRILGSGMRMGKKLISVLLVIAAGVGIYYLTDIPRQRGIAYSNEFREAFEDFVVEGRALPTGAFNAETLADAKMVYCEFSDDTTPKTAKGFTSEHIPPKNRAVSPEETDVIIAVSYGNEAYGRYTDYTPATRQFCIVTALDVRDKTIIAEKKIYGDPPPDEISSNQSRWGPLPTDNDIERYIISLIDGSTYENRQKDMDTAAWPQSPAA